MKIERPRSPAKFRTTGLARLVEINNRCRLVADLLRRRGPAFDADPEAADRWWNEGGAARATSGSGEQPPDPYNDPAAYDAYMRKQRAASRAASKKANAKREFTTDDWEDIAGRMRRIAQDAVALAQYAETAARQAARQ